MTIGRLRIRLHPLFAIVALLSVLTGYVAELLVLFGIVLIHELGHLSAASGFGWRIVRLQLLPFGGVLEVEQSGIVPAWQEIAVALAGPVQNAFMIAVAYALEWAGVWSGPWTAYFVQANLMIGLFNLLPALPLDGGKVMQSLMSLMMPYYRCLTLGVWISLAISLFIIGFSLWRAPSSGIHLNLLMIGLFLWWTNWYARKHVPFQFMRFLVHRSLSSGEFAGRADAAEPIVVGQSTPISDMLKLMKRERRHLFYVVNGSGVPRAVVPDTVLLKTYLSPRKFPPPAGNFSSWTRPRFHVK
jgi:Zn-dependent proteases